MIKIECNNTIVLQFDNTGLILRAKKNLNFINRSAHAPFGHIQTEVCLMRSHVCITRNARSAPVRLLHSSRHANAFKSTPDEMGLLRACAFNIETRSIAPGKGT